MAIVSLPNLGPDPFTVNASVLNGKVDPLATDYNGNIDNTNIASGAAIANSKLNLATISQAVTMTGGLTVSTTVLTMSSMPLNEAKGSDIASATTPNITSATGNMVHITGTTTITGFATATAGIRRILVFDGILTFTHNSTSLILPTGANITTAAGDTAVMVSEGSGNWRCTSYQRKDGTALSATTFTPSTSNALSGSIIQVVNTVVVTSTTGTTTIPNDDTIPQNTEGDQYMSLAITPSNSSNKLRIDVVFCGESSAGDAFGTCLFQDTTAGALAASYNDTFANVAFVNTFTHYMSAGTTSATTFKVRAGGASGTTTFNGSSSARKYGGVLTSSITISEVKA